MKISYKILREEDVENVDALGRCHRSTIGFLTKVTIIEYLKRNRVIGAVIESGELVGFLLFADYPDRLRIAQLCVDQSMQGQGIARGLFDALKASATNQKVIKLSCRRDFPAHSLWSHLGFISLGEKVGRSKEGLPLTLWCYRLNHDDELGLWKVQESEGVLDVVIDAQIFFDFDEPDTPKSLISKGLLNDFLVDSLSLWITDELFNEIGRHGCPDQRSRSWNLAHGHPRVQHNQTQAEVFADQLKRILPFEKASQKSDIMQLAKTAASKVRVFVTKDDVLLQNARKINEITALSVVHPVEIISSIHEAAEWQSYSPSRVSGLQLLWRRLTSSLFSSFDVTPFLNHGESRGKLQETLRSYLSRPNGFKCEVLESQGDPVAIRVLDRSDDEHLQIPLARIAASSDVILFGEFVVADSLSLSVEEDFPVISFLRQDITPVLEAMLLKMGFSAGLESFVRLGLCKCTNREKALAEIREIAPEQIDLYSQLSDSVIEQNCAPLVIDTDQPFFMIPIRPTFAMGLLDKTLSADDLFGGDPSVLLRWENVYYRRKSRHKMLKAPGKILWYVSGKGGAVVAISHLQEVESGLPKDLFRKYQKYGILAWKDIFNGICERDVNREIMALRFSRTFMFRHRITLREIRAVFKESQIPLALESPSTLSFNTFEKLFKLGYPEPA